MDAVILDSASAQITRRDYCCAGCWGHLVLYDVPGQGYRVACPNCGDGRGFVTKHYSSWRKSEDHADAVEVKIMLESIGVLQATAQSEQDILRELGF